MAYLIKVHEKKNPGRAYISQIEDPPYNIFKELTNIFNALDEGGATYINCRQWTLWEPWTWWEFPLCANVS